MKEFFKDWVYISVILILVTLGWQGLEMLMIGHINPNNVDSVITLILSLSLYGNLKMCRKI